MSDRPQIVIVETDHESDPPVGQQLEVLEFEPGDFVIVGWNPNERRPSSDRRWPMLREHVRPVNSGGQAA